MSKPDAIADGDTRERAVTFFNHEAEALDDGKLNDWLELLHEDLAYRVPIRVARENEASKSQFSDESFHLNEDKSSLRSRVDRFNTEYAWAENPRSRTRRFVSNVRVVERERDRIRTKSNLLVYRNRGDNSDADLISAERHDTLVETDDGLRLRKRRVLLDHTVMGTRDLSIFL